MRMRTVWILVGLPMFFASCHVAPHRSVSSREMKATQLEDSVPKEEDAAAASSTEDADGPANSIVLKLGLGDSAEGDITHSVGLEYHRFIVNGFGLEVGLHSVTQEDFFGGLFGPEEDIDLTEFDLGARYTYTDIGSAKIALWPYCALGLAIVDVDGETSQNGKRVSGGSDLGAFARVGVNVLIFEALTLGIDGKTVFGTDDVDYTTAGFVIGWSF